MGIFDYWVEIVKFVKKKEKKIFAVGPDDKYVIYVPHPDCRHWVALIFDQF